uniref:Putative ABC-type branched-chain amino acid transport systems, periplasmic component n=1 Tax=mine drainage metagenome TaxID=410659 RepID=E6PPB6_9ZZZZ
MSALQRMVVVASLFTLTLAAARADELIVRIGTAGPLTGPQSAYGQDAVNGVILAIKTLNAQHAEIDGKPVLWKDDAEDDQADPKQATVVAQKFVDEKVNGVVGHLDSGCTYPASRIYDQAGIPDITPSSTDPKIAQQGFKTFFRMLANDDAIGAGLVQYAARTLHLKTVAVVDDGTAYGQGIAQVFSADAKKDGLRVVDRDYTSDHATDFTAILTKIKAAHPSLIFYGGAYTQAGPMLRQMRQLGIDSRFMGGDGICTSELAKLAGSAVNGVICAEGGEPLEDMPGGPAWKARYVKAFGAGALQPFSSYAYDATMVLAHAMMKANSADPKAYLPFIRTVDYDGVTKKNIRFTATGELVHPTITLSVFKDGQKEPLSVENVK